MDRIQAILAKELSALPQQVTAAIQLLDEGSTVPFISRYRKEATGGLSDDQLRLLQERLLYLRELEERKLAIIKSIDEQGKLTKELRDAIVEADTKTHVEDLYKPYVQKRRTKAQIAREAGLQPLAETLLANPKLVPEEEAAKFFNTEKQIETVEQALDGARQILMEDFADNAECIQMMREHIWSSGKLHSSVITEKESEGQKFSDYFDTAEALASMPSHRALALFRGRNEGFLRLSLVVDEGEQQNIAATDSERAQKMVQHHFNIADMKRAADKWLIKTAEMAWRVKIFTRLDTELKLKLKEAAENEAIKVFSRNMRDLLMAAPAGPRATMGLDPGFRTGVKIAVVDATGKFVDSATIYPHAPQNQWDMSVKVLAALCMKHNVQLLSIGNGTASRETDRLVIDLMKQYPALKVTKIVVSEAGASVYSASKLASDEFPDLDVSIRGAVSIARRLQDPLAELVKIDPKSIGVGQYQHDVNQTQLARSLDGVVEDCVNAVGVDVNTASVALLARISGLNGLLAKNIVDFRDKNGAFANRDSLKKVPRLGDKAFEQAAGFLRIANGDNPLDTSSVHPEAYPVVMRILEKTNQRMTSLIGNHSLLRGLDPKQFQDEKFGVPTIKDILAELEKPGRDPRPDFKTAEFREGVEKPSDLTPGMILEGVVTNVTNFGAFVDIGVHQDGLVHVSALSDTFVKDPHTVVKAGQVVKVKVLEVDLPRNRISLSMRMTDEITSGSNTKDTTVGKKTAKKYMQTESKPKETGANAFALAFAKAKK